MPIVSSRALKMTPYIFKQYVGSVRQGFAYNNLAQNFKTKKQNKLLDEIFVPKIFEFLENNPDDVLDVDQFIAHLEYNLPLNDYEEDDQVDDIKVKPNPVSPVHQLLPQIISNNTIDKRSQIYIDNNNLRISRLPKN